MNDSKKLFWPSAMTHGLFLGIALVLCNIIFYAAGKYNSKGISGYVPDLILIGGIVWAQISFRKNQENGLMTYGTALGYGTVVVFFSSILFAIYTLILLRYVDHSLISQSKTVAEQALLDKGFTPDMVEKQMKIAEPFFTPEFMSGTSIFSLTLVGFVISLITSIFTKKSLPDNFENAMKEVETESFSEQKESDEILPRKDEKKEDSDHSHREPNL